MRLGETSKADAQPDHPIRLVVVKTTPHEKRDGAAGNGLLPIATDFTPGGGATKTSDLP
ncbi:MAG: hypothetical protein KKA28_17625 [Planctomycetes bacterium]|nr:hypothetical protein [Planctomycetota bacterium]MCG2682648.1 hypothetical protein [Planctomycetales bacterium]